MKNIPLYAVLTGDLVNSTQLTHKERDEILHILEHAFATIPEKISEQKDVAIFSMYRGDSFQGIIKKPEHAYLIALLLRLSLRKSVSVPLDKIRDARIVIGIGEIEYFKEDISQSDGTAFRRSGPGLDNLKPESRTRIITPWETLNQELEVGCTLADAIIQKWTASQSEVVYELLFGKTQTEIASLLHITQGAINLRAKSASWHAIETFSQRVKEQIEAYKKHT